MSSTTTEAVVLRVIRYSDSQSILHLYTKDFGRIAAMVRRNRKKGSFNYYQPLFHLSFEINHQNQKTIQRISQIRFAAPYRHIPFSVTKATVAQFLAEILSKVIPEHEPDQELFSFLTSAFHLFDQQTNNFNAFHVVFLVHLTRFLGFYPGQRGEASSYFSPSEGTYVGQIMHDTIPQNISEPFDELLQTKISAFYKLRLEHDVLQELLSRILDFYRIHLNVNQLKSYDILKQVFNH